MSQIYRSRCVECGKEFEARRADAVLCSDKCRQAHRRKGITDKVVPGSVTDKDVLVCHALKEEKLGMINGELVAVNQWGEDVKALGPRDLYIRINLYPGVTWKTSPEYIELMRRLNEMPLEMLRTQGYFIPTWKENRPSMNKEKE